MSAWFVTARHIDCLVTAMIALQLEGVEEANATGVGKVLWAENQRSLECRYGDGHLYDQAVEAYEFRPYPVEDLMFVAKEAHCYDYQACECASYESSEALRLVANLCDAIAAKTGIGRDDWHEQPGYKEAPWGVDHG